MIASFERESGTRSKKWNGKAEVERESGTRSNSDELRCIIVYKTVLTNISIYV